MPSSSSSSSASIAHHHHHHEYGIFAKTFWRWLTITFMWVAFFSTAVSLFLTFGFQIDSAVCFGGMFRGIHTPPLETIISPQHKQRYVFTSSALRRKITTTKTTNTTSHSNNSKDTYEVFSDPFSGSLLTINRTLVLAEKDEVRLYEMIALGTMSCLPRSKKEKERGLHALVVGGGGLGILHRLPLPSLSSQSSSITLLDPTYNETTEPIYKYFFPHLYASFVDRVNNNNNNNQKISIVSSLPIEGSSSYFNIIWTDHLMIDRDNFKEQLIDRFADNRHVSPDALFVLRLKYPFWLKTETYDVVHIAKDYFKYVRVVRVLVATQIGGSIAVMFASNSSDPKQIIEQKIFNSKSSAPEENEEDEHLVGKVFSMEYFYSSFVM
eukprot:PhM_4_TR13550/c0_g1_i3/m.104385